MKTPLLVVAGTLYAAIAGTSIIQRWPHYEILGIVLQAMFGLAFYLVLRAR